MAILEVETVDIPARAGPVRARVARPKEARGKLPAVVAWSDIFQLTGPHARMVDRLAGYGFVVVAPEIYARIEPPGTAFDFERDRQRALDAAARLELATIDEDRRDVLDWTLARADVDRDRLGACGWCFGGHLAFRAALERDVRAAVCFYATGLHSGSLGAAQGTADTLDRAASVGGPLLLVWGTRDPHIPAEGRRKIHRALEDAGVPFEFRLYDAEHAFMRDEGPRHDPEASDRAFAEMAGWFERRLRVRETSVVRSSG